jgi:multidrug transporter EmrE-like cation transporter
MNRTSLSLVLCGVALNAGAQLLLKAGANRVGPVDLRTGALMSAARDVALSAPIVGGLLCYVVSVAFWIVALTRVEVSVAYPMLSIGYVVNAIAAWWLFGETLTPTKLTGILVIITGVFVLAWSGRGT